MSCYRIVVQGELSQRFASSFVGSSLEAGDGETTMVTEIIDQAQLQGLLSQLADLGLILLRLSQVAVPSTGPVDSN
jgi:hypothetical protein